LFIDFLNVCYQKRPGLAEGEQAVVEVVADQGVVLAFLEVVGAVAVVVAAVVAEVLEEDSLADAVAADSGVVLAVEDEGFVDHIHEYAVFLHNIPSYKRVKYVVIPQTKIRASVN